MNFSVNILGCGSATPTARHLPSSQVINFREQLMMIDCGEGAQRQYRMMKLKFSRLNHIFISHLHGDHFFGLPGLLSTLALHEIGGTIVVHTFADGVEYLRRTMEMFCTDTPFKIEYDIITPEHRVILDTKALTVETFPLHHRVPTVGFIFREKPKPRHIRPDMIEFHQVPVAQINAIREGADFLRPDGQLIPNAYLTTDANPSMSYAYCSDTAYHPQIAEYLRGVHTIYHESTYLRDNAHKAAPRGHSTAAEAGKIAAAAGAKRLILGHYSQAYNDDQLFAAEAATTFNGEIIAATEGLTINLL